MANATLDVFNYAQFTNNGAGVEWIPFDVGGTDYHRIVTMVDPTTGLPRLIFGNDQGVWSVLDNNGTFETQIGSSDALPGDQTATAISRSPSSTTGRRSPATPPLRSPAPCSTAVPRTTAGPVSDRQHHHQRQHRLERARRRRRRRGHRPARHRHALPVLLALLRRRRHRLLPGQRHRPDFRLAPGQRRPADPRPAVAVHGRRQLRRQPGQRPGRRHQLGVPAGSSPPPTRA